MFVMLGWMIPNYGDLNEFFRQKVLGCCNRCEFCFCTPCIYLRAMETTAIMLRFCWFPLIIIGMRSELNPGFSFRLCKPEDKNPAKNHRVNFAYKQHRPKRILITEKLIIFSSEMLIPNSIAMNITLGIFKFAILSPKHFVYLHWIQHQNYRLVMCTRVLCTQMTIVTVKKIFTFTLLHFYLDKD